MSDAAVPDPNVLEESIKLETSDRKILEMPRKHAQMCVTIANVLAGKHVAVFIWTICVWLDVY